MGRRLLISCVIFSSLALPLSTQARAACTADPDATAGLNATLYDQRSAEHALIAEQTFKAATAALAWAKLAPGDALMPETPLPPPKASSDLAVILDVDETVLDNSPAQAFLVRSDLAYCPDHWGRWIAQRAAAPIPGAVAFTQAAEQAGVKVFYVTNRACSKDDCRAKEDTMALMQRLGFARANDPKAFLLQNEEKDWTSDKSTRRARIAEDHRVIMMIGDQLTDFVSQMAAKAIWNELRTPIMSAAVEELRHEKPEKAQAYRTYQSMIGVRWFLLPNAQYGAYMERFGSAANRISELQAADIGPASYTVATWNAEWFMDPAEFDRVARQGCSSAGSNPVARSLPCNVASTKRRAPEDIAALQRYTARLDADIVALQEVDGPAAARLLFPKGYRFCFAERVVTNPDGSREAPVQDVGFAVREGIPYTCEPAWKEIGLTDNSVRWAARIQVNPGTASAVDMIAFHLKSGCSHDPLTAGGECPKLNSQVALLREWLAARPGNAPPLVMLGDFNRNFEFEASEDPKTAMWPNLDRPGAGERDLTAISQVLPYQKCNSGDRYTNYIDQIVVSGSLASRLGTASHVTQDPKDFAANLKISDHCAVRVELLPAR